MTWQTEWFHVRAGYFENEEAAGQAWDLAALKYFGESSEIISKLNFPASLAKFRQQQRQQHAGAASAASSQQPAAAAGAGPAEASGAVRQYRGVTQVGCFRAGCVLFWFSFGFASAPA